MISCTMLIFSASSFATKSNASFILSKAHSEALIFPYGLFVFFHVPFFKAVKPFFIIGSLQSVSWQHFTCSKYSLAGDSCCH